MYVTPSSASKKQWVRRVTLGAGAGFLNGLLGAGGGILLVRLFTPANTDSSPESVRNAFFCTLAAILPITALSAAMYMFGAQGQTSSVDITFLVMPAIAGGAVGALLLDRINTTLLKTIFSLLVLYAGIRMVMG